MLAVNKVRYQQINLIFTRRCIFSTNNNLNNRDDEKDKTPKLYPSSYLTKFSESVQESKNNYFAQISMFKKKLENIPLLLTNANKSMNKVTGYDTIQSLKSGIKSIEIELYQDRISLERESKKLKLISVKQNDTQNLINDLLSRKSTWSPKDLKSFTETYNENQQNIQDLDNQKQKVESLEKKVKVMEQDVHNLILKRYHEEQIWSDKIRKISTYGTLLLLVINLLSFFALHLLFEPRKRRKLVAAFEKETAVFIEDIKKQQFEQMKLLENQLSEKLDVLIAEMGKDKKTHEELDKTQQRNIFSYLKSFFRIINDRFRVLINSVSFWKPKALG
ncbi:hypothetical protein FOG50_03893 [Hanseniaspora uvarum]|nr:hypothetical protein FOG50_03893 [Hanseniaspora uvarum]